MTSSVSRCAENEKLAKIKIGSKVNGIESLKIERSPGKVLEFHFYYFCMNPEWPRTDKALYVKKKNFNHS